MKFVYITQRMVYVRQKPKGRRQNDEETISLLTT
jgi:hypothetical protein